MDVAAVTGLVEHVARTVVAPRFRDLVAGEVREKSPGDLVTVVDTEAEAALTAGLQAIAPGVPVVGEEATAERPELLDLLADAPRAWVVDPLDGTQAFVDGSPDHAVMVALVEHGECVAGWICLPEHGETYVAERGSGAFRNGERLTRAAAPADPASLRGGLAVRYLPVALRERLVRAAADRLPGLTVEDRLWSGFEYARLASGVHDVALYWRTWPWDHAPGAVLLRELGGSSRRLDGSDYRPGRAGEGLLLAADHDTEVLVRDLLGLT